MKTLTRFAVGIAVPAFIMAGGLASSAAAQGKAAMAPVQQKVLLENDKVRAFEFTQKPGQENTSIASTKYRIVRALKGGTLERTYADGKKEDIVWKAGEVRYLDKLPAYTIKNNGKTVVQTYTVQLK
jgi:negative regulator of sigma E activity